MPFSNDHFLSLCDLAPGHAGNPVCGPVTLDVPRGAAVAVVGPNGSGKSTLLRTLTGQLPAIAGEARYRGSLVDERDQTVRATVATVVDDDAYFPELTVAEHLVMVASAHGAADPFATTDAEIATFGLDRCRDAVPHTLSSGQRRRLLLAAAFVRPADLVVIDEPEQRLDADARHLVRARLAAVRAAGATTVVATHDPAFLDACDRVVVVGDVTRVVPADEAARELGAS